MATYSSFDKLALWHDDALYLLFGKDRDSDAMHPKRTAQFTSNLVKGDCVNISAARDPICAIPESLIPAGEKMPRTTDEIIEHIFGKFRYSYAHFYSLESYCFER